jgi:sec-independent protein translocase protein TatA
MPEATLCGHGRNNMGELLTPVQLIIVGIFALILFGAKKLPELAKGLGAGLREFKGGKKGLSEDIDGLGKPAQTILPKPTESRQ